MIRITSDFNSNSTIVITRGRGTPTAVFFLYI
nr:MAG TPA: hypothetical protein [Caudoviricetes sp.]